MSHSIDIVYGVIASVAAASIVTAYLVGKIVGADEERKRIVRVKANLTKSGRQS